MKTANPTKTKTNVAKRKLRKPAAARSASGAADRVTVRLKPALAARLATAKREQGQSVTEIIETALEKHLGDLPPRKPRMTLLEAFEKNGLLGTCDMGPDASTNYKRLVAEAIEEKHGYR